MTTAGFTGFDVVGRAVATRIVVTGGECTGKTSLAEALGARLGAPWLPEAARGYAEEAAREGRALTLRDVEPIARRHVAAENAAVGGMAGPAVIVLDTDLLSTVAYSRHYYGASSAWLESEARMRLGDIYLLCAPDIPWAPDGVRDRPGNREAMFAHFVAVLGEFGAHVHIVRGPGGARLDAAADAVQAMLAGHRS